MQMAMVLEYQKPKRNDRYGEVVEGLRQEHVVGQELDVLEPVAPLPVRVAPGARLGGGIDRELPEIAVVEEDDHLGREVIHPCVADVQRHR